MLYYDIMRTYNVYYYLNPVYATGLYIILLKITDPILNLSER